MTLHLLKQNAKPSKQREVRKKFSVLEFNDFKEVSKEDEAGKVGDRSMSDEEYKDVTNSLRKSKRNKGANIMGSF